MLEKIRVNRIGINRGRNAGLFSEPAPLSDEERRILWEGVVHTYAQFKREVAEGRGLSYDELDAICEGRVWTGNQAKKHKLVDSHGDFVDAIQQAAKIGELSFDENRQIKVMNLYAKSDGYILPQPYEALKEMERLLSGEWIRELSGRPMFLMPFSFRLE